MMQLYETIYITKQDLSDSQLKSIEEKYENLLKFKKANIEYKEKWGLRTLAYKIQNNKKGYYYFLVYNCEPEAVKELERNFKIDESIIRYLTTITSEIPSEPTPIMKAKIEKENIDNSLENIDLEKKEK